MLLTLTLVLQAEDGGVDVSEGKYGSYGLMQSKEIKTQELTRVGSLDLSKADQDVWVRGRLHTSRAKGVLTVYH